MEIGFRWTILITLLAGIILAAFLFNVTAGMVIPSTIQAEIPLTTPEFSTQEMTQEQAAIDDQRGQPRYSGTCAMSGEYPDRVLQWCEIITHYAEKRNLDPDLLGAVILQESGGNADAYSHSGAVGLMQVMPRDGLAASFMCPAGPCFSNRPSISELQDPEFNISYGSKMLKNLIGRYGNVREALKAYGPMDVGYSYSEKVLSIYRRYKD